ncbi:MAG: hypothetical protein KKB90_12215 [Actinobacteria bacterium]|nr:hypothetical protein [Actinomycetota bacterium]MCG2819048.1 hypothetical protein [Actinomycetes bacterium]MBU4219710.1 hypothetical protein [Actinomycetota bacterium]MBU4357681.1 hypothetical protein [Actinomycetota bacterium]MBU4391942.1 hypothetical protein [Actinomycetota bacterium]
MNEQASISSTRNLILLRELAAAGPSGMSAEHASIVSRLSRPSTFRALDELRTYGIVEKNGSVWRLVAGNPYVIKAVGILDAERFMLLDESVRREVAEVARQADDFYGENHYALVAFGSAVGELPLDAEDIDILIVVEDQRDFRVITRQMKASISFLSPEEIEEQWAGGEQFIQETIARGILVRDPLEKLARLRVSRTREFNLEKALDSYLDLYRRENDLASMAYSDKNWEQVAFHQNKAAAALARIWLLGIGVRPRSRPELADQLGMLCSRLRNEYVHLTKETPDDEDHAEEREREFWAFRSSTSHLSDSTREFSELLGLLQGSEREAIQAIRSFMLSRGLTVTLEHGDSDLKIRNPESRRSLNIEVKSSTSNIGIKAIQAEADRHAAKRNKLALVYNPHRNLPADQRKYEVSRHAIEIAKKAGMCLVPSNVFFSWACDAIEEDLKGTAAFDSFMELCEKSPPVAQAAS